MRKRTRAMEIDDNIMTGDVVDSIRTRQRLNATQITDVLHLFVSHNTFGLALVDPALVTLYMREEVAGKQSAIMARYFRGDKQQPVTLIPVHHDDHWSLLIYVARYTTFYYLDSLSEYHREYVVKLMRKMMTDGVIANIDSTRVTTITSECQENSYECGQYLFMFVYAFLVQYKQAQQQQDVQSFADQLQVYVAESCRESHRQKFIRLIIAWIHDSRGY